MRLLKAGIGAAVLMVGFAIGTTGCLVTENHDGSATIWSPVVGHVHSDDCGHYRRNDSWYHAKGHRHGHNCGHHQDNGIWIVRY